MRSYEALLDRLPRVYRPEPDDVGLFARTLRAYGDLLDDVNDAAALVMQSHWFAYADQARFSAFYLRGRELRGLPTPPAPTDPELESFAYLDDLPRIGALLGILPRSSGEAERESAEEYRRRVRRMVRLYKNGLGTVGALRLITEAALPADRDAPEALRDRPLQIEEFSPVGSRLHAARGRGEPAELVGPLMRWTVHHEGLAEVPPVAYLQGVTPVADLIDATVDPILELFSVDGRRVRRGIGMEGTLAPGRTLRLRPAFDLWVGGPTGVAHARSAPAGEHAADPTVPQPWAAVPEAPSGRVAALCQSQDGILWVAVNADDSGALHRSDGTAWTVGVEALPLIHCLAAHEQELLIGTETGLLRLPLYPEEGTPLTPVPVPGLETAIHAILQSQFELSRPWWVGTENGLARLDAEGTVTPFGLTEAAGTAVPVFALFEDDPGGTLSVGTALGLFQFQPRTGAWYWYEGREFSDQKPDWQRLEAGLPDADGVFLPPVRAILRGPDVSLWLGTDRGIARYTARAVTGFAFTSLLEAFPDVTESPVHALAEDARGRIWFATDAGLYRWDGRDWWQGQPETAVGWARLGQSVGSGDREADTPRAWRFARGEAGGDGAWQKRDPKDLSWIPADVAQPLAAAQPAVTALRWSDGAVGDLGTLSLDGSTFTPDPPNDPPADPPLLFSRYKPDETRVVPGGLPSVPRLPVGSSVWRYLRRQPPAPQAPPDEPEWNWEGRLLLPAPLDTPQEGRYGNATPPEAALSDFDEAVFAYNPSARVWMEWAPRTPLAVLVRLLPPTAGPAYDPALLDRVWQGIQQVRPAGLRVLLAVNEETVRDTAQGA